MKNKLTLTTVALAIFAPISIFVFLDANDMLWAMVSKVMMKMEWAPYYFGGLSGNMTLALGYAFMAGCYALLVWMLIKMYRQMKEGMITKRTLVYTSVLAGILPWLAFVSLVGVVVFGIGDI